MVESNANIIMRCKRCNQNVPLMEMKYDKDGKSLICRQCRGLSMQEHLDKLKQKKRTQERTQEAEAAAKAPGSKYRCTSCGFSFTRGKIKPARCPYCSKDSVVELRQISSEKLLRDV